MLGYTIHTDTKEYNLYFQKERMCQNAKTTLRMVFSQVPNAFPGSGNGIFRGGKRRRMQHEELRMLMQHF